MLGPQAANAQITSTPAIELGFSGALFGIMGFLMARGWFDRRPLSIVLSLVAMSWFGGSLLLGLFPQYGISWTGHFWGLVGGLVAARLLPRKT